MPKEDQEKLASELKKGGELAETQGWLGLLAKILFSMPKEDQEKLASELKTGGELAET